MLTLAFIQCRSDKTEYICTKIKEIYSNEIKLCITAQGINSSWRELALAFINTIKAIENKENIARKPEVEFYIRLFSERQINTVLNEYLPRFSEPHNILLIYHKNELVLINLENILNEFECSIKNPINLSSDQFYTKYLEIKFSKKIMNTISSKNHDKIVLGIIGCSNILTKE